jgi:hypothetical protein
MFDWRKAAADLLRSFQPFHRDEFYKVDSSFVRSFVRSRLTEDKGRSIFPHMAEVDATSKYSESGFNWKYFTTRTLKIFYV